MATMSTFGDLFCLVDVVYSIGFQLVRRNSQASSKGHTTTMFARLCHNFERMKKRGAERVCERGHNGKIGLEEEDTWARCTNNAQLVRLKGLRFMCFGCVAGKTAKSGQCWCVCWIAPVCNARSACDVALMGVSAGCLLG